MITESKSVTLGCKQQGITRQTFYTWLGALRRSDFDAFSLAEKSRRPKKSPRKISDAIQTDYWPLNFRTRRLTARLLSSLICGVAFVRYVRGLDKKMPVCPTTPFILNNHMTLYLRLAFMLPMILYCALAFGVTWSIVISGYLLWHNGLISYGQLNTWHAAGALGPAVAAVIAIAREQGSTGLRMFVKKLYVTRPDRAVFIVATAPVWLFAVGYFSYPLFKGQAYSLAATQTENGLTTLATYLIWLLPAFSYALFEELGWRGFLLPRLQSRFTAIRATVVLTTIWALWHIPFFLYRFKFSPPIAVGFFFGLFVGSILLTFLVNQTRGQIAAAILFHLLNNLVSALDKEYIVAVLSSGFVIISVTLLVKYGAENLATTERVKNSWQKP